MAKHDAAEFNIEIPIVRIDEERREVWGAASTEEVGRSDGMVLKFEASQAAAQRWGGNVREMHQPKAVGRSVRVVEDEENRRIYVGARISRGAEDTWQKVLDGTLAYYSVKGPIHKMTTEVRRVNGADKAVPVVTDYDWSELSLVDNPGDAGVKGEPLTVLRIGDADAGAADEGDVEDVTLEALRLAFTARETGSPLMVERSDAPDVPTADPADPADPAVPAAEPSEPEGAPAEDAPVVERAEPSAEDEMTDAQLAGEAARIIRNLIAREAAQGAASGDDEEQWDISLLQTCLDWLNCFAAGEVAEAIEALRVYREGTEAMGALQDVQRDLGLVRENLATLLVQSTEQKNATEETVQRSTTALTELTEKVDEVVRRIADVEAQDALSARPMARITGEVIAEGPAGVERALDVLEASMTEDQRTEFAPMRALLEIKAAHAAGPQQRA